jgi:HSP20 family molecular chaperone IbpA
VEKKEDIQLRVDERSIDLSAKHRRSIRYERWGTVQRNCEFRTLSTTIPLPAEVDPEQAVARFRDGLLKMELPKKTKKKLLRIE